MFASIEIPEARVASQAQRVVSPNEILVFVFPLRKPPPPLMPSNIDLTWAQSCRSIRLQLESEADRWCDNPGAAQAATIAEQDQTGRAILARSEIHISIYSTSLIKFHWWLANVKKLSTVTHRDSSSLPPFLQLLRINGNNKQIVHGSIFVLISAPVQMTHATKLFPSRRPAFWWPEISLVPRVGLALWETFGPWSWNISVINEVEPCHEYLACEEVESAGAQWNIVFPIESACQFIHFHSFYVCVFRKHLTRATLLK